MQKAKANQQQRQRPLRAVAVAYTKPTTNRAPRISNRSDRTGIITTVRHREFIADIAQSHDFAITKYRINPGDKSSFPWLSRMANLFETYRFKDLKYSYEPTCGSTTPGSVNLAVDFDASDDQPPSKAVMMSYHNARRISPWSSVTYSATQQDLTKFAVSRYTRSIQPPNTDIKTYDVGNFYIAVSGADSSTGLVGELYVEYTVDLYTPQLPPTSVQPETFIGTIGNNGFTLPLAGQPFGPNPKATNYNGTGFLSIDANGVELNEPGRYLAVWSVDISSNDVNKAGIGASDGVTVTQIGDVNRSDNVWIFDVPVPPATIDFVADFKKAPTSSILRVCPLPNPLP